MQWRVIYNMLRTNGWSRMDAAVETLRIRLR